MSTTGSSTRRGRRLSAFARVLGVLLQALLVLALLVGVCRDRQPPDRSARFTLLQLNDVYEIAPLAGSDLGGLARVATLRRRLLAEDPNTFTLLAGDFLSPSALGTLKIGGNVVAGRQMVDVLRRVGVDLATLGNHEFDLQQHQLEARLAEGAPPIRWLAANVRRADGTALPKVLPRTMLRVAAPNGAEVRIGVFGLTIPTDKEKDYVVYQSDFEAVARREADALRAEGAHVVVALTHLAVDDDQAIARNVPGIDLVLGGHEHDAMLVRGGTVPIAKADSNARTVWVHRLVYDTAEGRLTLQSTPLPIDHRIPADRDVDAAVRDWMRKAHEALREMGFRADAAAGFAKEPLDGSDRSVRAAGSNLTRLVAGGMLQAVPEAELALFNSGGIRIDDRMPPGKLTEWDAFRVLPYEGSLQLVRIDGASLRKLLDDNAARAGRSDGRYLQFSDASRDAAGAWSINGQALDDARLYRVVMNDFVWCAKKEYPALQGPGATLVRSTMIPVQAALIGAFRTRLPVPGAPVPASAPARRPVQPMCA
jgi:5'-nucleotidase / UDP-sugar diphosphatase